jgi:photosystem II stability/assembly factor-like uncharacterized protein
MNMMKILINIFLFFWISCLAISQTPQWHIAQGTENIAINAMDICRSSPDTLYAFGDRVDTGMYPGMFLRSTNHGESWDSIAQWSSGIYSIAIDPKKSQSMYISVEHPFSNLYSYVNKTYDSGEHWTTLVYGCCFRVPVIEIDPINTQIVYVITGFGRLSRSTDGGETWSYDSLAYDYPKSLSVSPVNDSIIYLAGNVVLRSTDLGSSWEELPVLSYPSVVRAHPKNPDIVYAGVSGIGMYKSTDRGSTWIEKNNGLNYKGIINFVINPERPDEIYIGLESGKIENKLIYRTTDGGDSWIEFSDGLPSPGYIRSMVVDTVYDKTYITVSSVNGHGIYIYDFSTSVAENPVGVPTAYTLEQNYPNPFNPTTIIKYQIPKASFVSLKVFDLFGRTIETLVDREQGEGYHDATWNASKYSSGIYFYNLKVGGFSQTRKAIFIK